MISEVPSVEEQVEQVFAVNSRTAGRSRSSHSGSGPVGLLKPVIGHLAVFLVRVTLSATAVVAFLAPIYGAVWLARQFYSMLT